MIGEVETPLRDLTLRQKLTFLRKRLDEVPEFDSEGQRGGLWFRLLHPEVLDWKSTIDGVSALPPQEGKIKALIVDKYLPHQRRKLPIAAVLDFTRTAHVTGVSYAAFGLNALGVTEDDELVIDCRQISAPTNYLQYALPNFFVNTQGVNQTEPEKTQVA